MIDPAMQVILDRARGAPAPSYETMPLAEGRETFTALAAGWNRPVPALARAIDFQLPGLAGARRARDYRPTEAAGSGPAIVYVHGGGWTFGSIDTHDRSARLLALDSGLRVISIDYRLAPEHPFPAGMDDVLAAIRFLERTLPSGEIAIAGDSAGANLALGATLARSRSGEPALGAALLFYGCYAPDFTTDSHRRLGDGTYLLSTARMRWYWRNLLGAEPSDTTSLAAPLRAPAAELAALPPLYLNAAGLDPLLDDTLALAQRLAAAGGGYRLDVVSGVVHGFHQMSAELPAARQSIATAAEFVKTHLKRKNGKGERS